MVPFFELADSFIWPLDDAGRIWPTWRLTRALASVFDAVVIPGMTTQKYRQIAIAIAVRRTPDLFSEHGTSKLDDVGDRQVGHSTHMRMLHYAIPHGLPTGSIEADVMDFELAIRVHHLVHKVTHPSSVLL